MSRHVSLLLTSLLAMVLLSLTAGFAQSASTDNSCAPPGYRTDVRPNPSGPATEVTLGVRLVDLQEINDVNQTLTVDLAMLMSWTDPRLAHLEGCQLALGEIWFPELTLKNSGRMFKRWPQIVSVEEGGLVTYLQRISGTFSSYHKLKNFPLDHQAIKLRFYPLRWSLGKVTLKNNDKFSGATNVLNISDWEVTGTGVSLVEEDFRALGKVHAGYEFEITAERYVSYYFWKIVIPLSLIVFMSWSVFWIDPKQFGTQMGLSATSVLTMIAFIFATTNMLPRLGHFTLLDKFIAGSTFMVFIALLQSLVTGFLVSKGHVNTANRIDLTCRLAFPVVFAIYCVVLYGGAAG